MNKQSQRKSQRMPEVPVDTQQALRERNEQAIIAATTYVPQPVTPSIGHNANPIERDTLRNQIVEDIMAIEARHDDFETARMTLLVDAIRLHKLGGLNLRVEPLGTLRHVMLTAKGGWCETSFAPALKLVWGGKLMDGKRKKIIKDCAITLHYVMKGDLSNPEDGRLTNGVGGFFFNAKSPHCPAEIVTAASGLGRVVVKFTPLNAFAMSAMAEPGKERKGSIEQGATDLITALGKVTHDDVPASAWNALSILAGRLSVLLSARDKAVEAVRAQRGDGAKSVA